MRTTSEGCPSCAAAGPSDDPDEGLGVIRWRLIPSWGGRTGYPVSFECPHGHSSRSIGELQAWFGVRAF
jgi:hypothetical protein